ncbi:MAG: glutathione peroxidase [Crocinitomix sp.]|nr:glutathione peroxidase [Crocinitomix sp.]
MKTLNLMILFMTLTTFGQSSIHDFKFVSITGEERSFSEFKGKKILIVNTASECGFTPQYEDLEKLHQAKQNELVIIGFPANNFGGQEPGKNKEIAAFCQKNYGVTFLLSEKVSVDGADIAPLFKWLCAQENPSFTGPIKWNFEKFLLDEEGNLIDRFRSTVKPTAQKILGKE